MNDLLTRKPPVILGPPMTIIVDTREQAPYPFTESGYSIVREALPEGDYGVLGLPYVAVERKSLNDLIGSLTFGRERFFRELARLRSYRVCAIVVEASLSDILQHHYESAAAPASIVGSLLAIVADMRIPVLLCGDRPAAQAATLRLLERAWLKRGSRRRLRSEGRRNGY